MQFGEQIRQVRKSNGLSQEQMGQRLGVTRQAISNWENDRNLPDLEMIILIAQTFGLTLDELILGGTNMNNMTEKLIDDGSEGRRVRRYTNGLLAGAMIVMIGVALLIFRSVAVVSIDEYGVTTDGMGYLIGAIMLVATGVGTALVSGLFLAQDHLRRAEGASRIAWVAVSVAFGLILAMMLAIVVVLFVTSLNVVASW